MPTVDWPRRGLAHRLTGRSDKQTRALLGGSIAPTLIVDGHRYHIGEVHEEGSTAAVVVDEKRVIVEILRDSVTDPSSLLLRSGNHVLRVLAKPSGIQGSYLVAVNGIPLTVRVENDSAPSAGSKMDANEGPILVTSPMAGKIAAVKASAGVMVEEGQALIMLEAMKMENEIAAPRKGRVKEVYVQPGALARSGEKLVLIE